MNVGCFTRERHPTERTATLAEKRTNVRGNKSWEVVGVLHAALKGKRANVIAVVEGDRSHLLQAQHAFNVARHRVKRLLLICLRIASAQFQGLLEGHAVRNVSV